MTTLIKRAVKAAEDRDRRAAEDRRAQRERGREEFEAATRAAAAFAGGVLEMEISPDQLRHEEQTWLDGDDLAWDLTVDGLEFGVERSNTPDHECRLYWFPDPERVEPICYLADLAVASTEETR